MSDSRVLIWCYVPVIHEGYLRWFAEYPGADIAIVALPEILERRYLVKDIRRLDPSDVQKMLARLLNCRVMMADSDEMKRLSRAYDTIVMPNESIMHELWEELESDRQPIFAPIFLRWDRDNIMLDTEPRTVDPMVTDGTTWTLLSDLAKQSPDWWRQIACCIVRDGEVLLSAFNHPMPSDETVWYQGDPRAVFNKGVHLELSSFIHAEASVISQAARQGIALEGSDLYVTTFPCPPCAKLVAEVGINRLLFRDGYSVLDGNDVLEAAGIEIIKVGAE